MGLMSGVEAGSPVAVTCQAGACSRSPDQRDAGQGDSPAAAAHPVRGRGGTDRRAPCTRDSHFPGTAAPRRPDVAQAIRHFLQFRDFSRAELEWVFERTRIIKERFKRYEFYQPLRDRTLAMVFEKASTRTRVSFEAGMYQMGGSVIHITTGDSQLGRAERSRTPLA